LRWSPGYDESDHQQTDLRRRSIARSSSLRGNENAARQRIATLWTETDPLVDQHRERIERIATKLEVDREWSGEQVREVLREVQ
jgi:hypothetical protein